MLKRKMTATVLCLLLLASVSMVSAASNRAYTEANLPLPYEKTTMNDPNTNYQDYITYRTPLTNTYKKLTEDKELTVVYLGGSLTAGTGLADETEKNNYSWRGLSGKWLKENFPDAVVKTINAAVGESGTFLGTYRVQEDVIANKPDLLFIEYAINDYYKQSSKETAALQFETIVREVRKALPDCDIVTVLTTEKNLMSKSYNLELFDTAQGHSDIAEAYDLPVINVGSSLAKNVAQIENNDAWWTDSTLWNKYFTDIVHLTKAGYEQYWLCIREYLENSLLKTDYSGVTMTERPLPTLYSSHLLDGDRRTAMGMDMRAFYVADRSVNCNYNINKFHGGNDTPHYGSYNVEKDGTVTFKFSGTEFAFWSNQYNNAIIRYVIDDGTANTINCDGHAPTLIDGLQSGEHTISITPVTLEKNTTVMKIGGIFMRDASKQTEKIASAIQYKVDEYKESGTYPTQKGKVFAGWYQEETCETPYTGTTGTAWAKFADEDVLSVKLQLAAGTTAESAATKVRFITAIDTLKFRCVGFEVNVPSLNKSYNLKETTAYTSIQVEDGVILTATPIGTFGSTAKYFVVHTLKNIPKAAYGEPFIVKPYWYTMDGTKVYGVTLNFTVKDILMMEAQNLDNEISDNWTLSD